MSGGMMWGADVDALDGLARDLSAVGDTLQATRVRLQRIVHTAPWRGLGADRFRHDWDAVHGRSVADAASALQHAATLVRRHATDQRQASRDTGGATGGGRSSVPLGPACIAPETFRPRQVTDEERRRLDSRRGRILRALDTGGWSVTRSDLAAIRDQFDDLTAEDREALMLMLTDEQRAVLRDQMQESRIKGGWTHDEQASFVALFDGQPDAMRTLLGDDYPVASERAPVGLSDPIQVATHGIQADRTASQQDQIKAKNQITIVQLDNGNWAVHLPGVTDLSQAFEDKNPLVWTEPNPTDSPRDMRWAIDSGTRGSVEGGSWDNPYAASVRIAMQDAGVPPGARLLLTGHSFGSYAAMELAADRTFNNPTDGGYHVVSVIAMGADTDWRMDDMPSNTSGLVLNNANDQAFEVERKLHRDPETAPDNWQEIVFDGGEKGHGHDPANYEEWLVDNVEDLPPELNQFTGNGTSYQYAVKDIYR